MLTPQRSNKSRREVARNTSLPAPVKGWSSFDSMAEADPQTALVIDNFFPESDAVRARHGCVVKSTGIGGSVDSLLVYPSQTASSKLFAAKASSIYDCTAGGAVGAAVVTGLTNGRWSQTMFANSAGQFLVICNGADGVRTYDGTTWANRTGNITATGGSVTSFTSVCAHMQRLWFVEDGTTNLWYLPTFNVAAAATNATLFPVGAYLKLGGKPLAICTWSSPEAYQLADMLVVISDRGEGLVFQGTDPGSAATWQLKVRFEASPPMSARCFMPIGGDVLLLTEMGLLPISQILEIDPAALSQKAMTRNIRRAYRDAATGARNIFGWCITSLPQANMGIINVPAYGSQPSQQFVLNTVTGAWCRFTGWNAISWAYLDGAIYYGDATGKVYRAEYGANDNGVVIPGFVVPAFSHLGAEGRLKSVHFVRPIIYTDTNIAVGVAAAVDYTIPSIYPNLGAFESGHYFTWDVSIWDGTDVWRGDTYNINWEGIGNVGTTISPAFAASIDAGASGDSFQLRVIGFDLVYEVGGVV